MSKKWKALCLLLLSGIFLLFFLSGLKQTRTVYINTRPDGGSIPATAQLTNGEAVVSIDAWRSQSGMSYLFLPSWAEDRLLQTDGEASLTILTGSDIPSVFLTLKHDLSHIASDKEQSDSGQALILDADGETVYSGGLARIKGRGNTSWEQDKKPYNITLENSVSIPGMSGQSAAYSLISSSDLTFLRNRISSEMGVLAGTSAMPSILVNLYINNSFEGVYELCQRITPKTLGITDLEELTAQSNPLQDIETLDQLTTGLTLDDWNQSITGKWWDYENDPEDITGGYILESDNAMRYTDEDSGFILDSGAYMVSKSPSRLTEAQYQYIRSYVQECENVMRQSVGLDDCQALSALIDIPSFVGKYLVEEVSKNIDCSATSQYFYKDRNGILYAGPVWDYDWAYGVERIQEDIDYMDPEGFSAREIPGSLIWWQLLYYNNAFYHDVVTLYGQVLYPWLSDLTESGLSAWEEELSASAVMDYLRWERVSPADAEASLTEQARLAYHGQVGHVRSFLAARKEFLRREWLG